MLDKEIRTSLYYRYSKASELPLLILALLMIPLLVVPQIFNLTEAQEAQLEPFDWFIYACFAVDYLVKLYLAPSRWEHIRRNWLDLVILTLPLLRPLRIIQGARVLRLIRAVRLLAFMLEALRKLRDILTGRGLHWVLAITVGVVLLSALLVWLFERGSGGSIKEYGDAIWWAVATVTTVGYGDAIPITAEGRGIALFLMVAGIVFFSLLTANIAAYFVESGESKTETDLEGKIDLILRRLDELEDKINRTPPDAST